jgi:ribose transport system permease protein
MNPSGMALAGRMRALPMDRVFVVFSRLLAVVVLVSALSLLSPVFFTWGNLLTVARQAALQLVMSAGLTLVILAGGIDLSVGAVIGLSACLAATWIAAGQVALGLAAGLSAGLACGVCNGVLVAYARIPAFIASYGMLWIAQGLGYVFMKGNVIHGFPAGFRFVGVGFVWGLPALVLIGIGVLIALHVMLHFTVLGRSIYAIGGNPNATRLSGMPVRVRLIAVYGLSGLLSGLAALIVIARLNAAESSVGEDLLLPAIAAVCLGGTSLFGGVGGMMGTAVGSLILALIVNGMNLLGVQTLWQNAVMGGIILLSVLTDQLGGARLLRGS